MALDFVVHVLSCSNLFFENQLCQMKIHLVHQTDSSHFAFTKGV